MDRIEAELNVRGRVVYNGLFAPQQAAGDRGRRQTLLQHNLLLVIHEFAAVDDQPAAAGPDARNARLCSVPSREMAAG